MMENFNIDARQLKAAMIFQAKNDVRYYLNGVLIGSNRLVATNGHKMIVVDSDGADFDPVICNIKGTIPKAAVNCEFVFIDDESGVIFFTTKFGVELNQVLRFGITDASSFPDYERAIPDGEPNAPVQVAFNTQYMADIDRACTALGSTMNAGKFTFYEKSVLVDISNAEQSAKCVIMGLRM